MTVKGWMVVFTAIIFGIILASCAKSNHDDGANNGPREMSCAEYNSFVSSGVSYRQEGNHIVLINGQGQRYVMSDREAQAGLMANRCQNEQFGGYPQGQGFAPQQQQFPQQGFPQQQFPQQQAWPQQPQGFQQPSQGWQPQPPVQGATQPEPLPNGFQPYPQDPQQQPQGIPQQPQVGPAAQPQTYQQQQQPQLPSSYRP